jgi:hypothetical protein
MYLVVTRPLGKRIDDLRDGLSKRLDRIESRLDKIEQRVAALEKRVEGLEIKAWR